MITILGEQFTVHCGHVYVAVHSRQGAESLLSVFNLGQARPQCTYGYLDPTETFFKRTVESVSGHVGMGSDGNKCGDRERGHSECENSGTWLLSQVVAEEGLIMHALMGRRFPEQELWLGARLGDAPLGDDPLSDTYLHGIVAAVNVLCLLTSEAILIFDLKSRSWLSPCPLANLCTSATPGGGPKYLLFDTSRTDTCSLQVLSSDKVFKALDLHPVLTPQHKTAAGQDYGREDQLKVIERNQHYGDSYYLSGGQIPRYCGRIPLWVNLNLDDSVTAQLYSTQSLNIIPCPPFYVEMPLSQDFVKDQTVKDQALKNQASVLSYYSCACLVVGRPQILINPWSAPPTNPTPVGGCEHVCTVLMLPTQHSYDSSVLSKVFAHFRVGVADKKRILSYLMPIYHA